MQLTEKAWTNYINRLRRLNEAAGQKMADYIARHGTADTAALAAYAEALVTKYGEGSAELACQMYDAIAALQRADVPPAEPATPAGHSEVNRMVQATRNSPPQLRQGVSRMVKQTAADTTVKNALRDGAEWAWVPHGDTCPFCLTLASRGWQRASNAVLKGGHAEHIHANCDCEFAIRFDGHTGVAGYDPERYLEQYNAAGGDLNKLRRINYAANKDRINAQKRAAYAARKAQQEAQSGLHDVLVEYLANAKPGVGTVKYDDGYRISHHAEEIKTAQWLHENLGGDIVLLSESEEKHQKSPDFLWNNKQWELKSITTVKASDSALRSAVKQISENPGGIILDCGTNKITGSALKDAVENRIERSCDFDADILVIQEKKLYAAYRHKK